VFKIGDFARISQVPVSALRYYDEVGLLKPASVDRFTGYRYYSIDQLPRLNRLLALRDLGLPLEQVARLLEADIPPSELRGILTLRRTELQSSIELAQARLKRVELRLQQIEMEGKMPDYDIVLKQVEPQPVISAASVVEDRQLSRLSGAFAAEGDLVELIGKHCDRLAAQVGHLVEQPGAKGRGPWMLIYEQQGEAISLEMAAPVEANAKGQQVRGLRELPGYEAAASVVHHGTYDTLLQAYSALGQWIESSGYQVCGPCREIYLHHDGDNLNNCCVTEVQFPVERG
jgi:DNA-binding transcriptional MerR regulator/effector-binding domain-containing protein